MVRRVHDILQEHGLAPHRFLGQNFLVNQAVAARIADSAGLDHETTVVEIGVGLAGLTVELAARAGRVIGIEIDRGLVALVQREHLLPANVTLRHEDALETDFPALAREYGPLCLVANLPYAVTSPLLFRLAATPQAFTRAVLMVQKEVATRLLAPAGSRDYGLLTVLLGRVAAIDRLFDVGPANFHPRPRVDSTVIRLTFTPPPAGTPLAADPESLRRVVKAAFNQRRKTLANSLAALAGGRSGALALCDAAAIDPQRRAASLTIDEFCALARAWYRRSTAIRHRQEDEEQP